MCIATLAVIGAVVGAAGTVQEGLFNSEVAKNNAIVAGQNADYARASGAQQADVASMKGAAKVARIKTGQAAGNIDVNTGSAVDVQAGQREVNKLDVDTIINNAELQAYGYTVQQNNFEAQSDQAIASAVWGATGDLLSSASSMGTPTGTVGTAAPKIVSLFPGYGDLV